MCKECELDVNDIEPVRCGFCDAVYHISQQCCGFNYRTTRDILSQGKVMFICSDCRSELNGRSVKCYLEDKMKTQTTSPTSVAASDNLSSQLQLLTGVVDKLSKKVDDLASASGGTKTNQLSTPSFRTWPKPGAKRPRVEQYDSPAVANDRGTRTIDLSDLSIASIMSTPSPPKFWLYLSGFQPLISPEDVQKIVARCLDLSTPCDVIRLVPKGKDISSMSFVSFTIGLDPLLQNRALQASTWLEGLVFREFVDQSKNFRRPSVKPVDITQTPV